MQSELAGVPTPSDSKTTNGEQALGHGNAGYKDNRNSTTTTKATNKTHDSQNSQGILTWQHNQKTKSQRGYR